MTPTDPAGTTGIVADWLARLDLRHVPQSIVERAAHVALDGVGCALTGARLPWSDTAVAAITELDGQGRGTILGWGRTTTPSAAAVLNGTFIQGFELDDYHPLGPLHSASVVLPAAFAAAEHRRAVTGTPVPGTTLLRAWIAGFELGPRVGMALHGGDMISRGWHSGPVFGTHAAAAAAGVVLGLDAAGFEDALGLAATQSAGLMAAQYEAMCKRMHHGFSARAGLSAAVLAARGFTGIKRVFEREYGGYLATFGAGGRPPVARHITDGLGTRWELERISIKPYAAQGGTHAAIDAVNVLRERHPFTAAEVSAIDIEVGHTVYHHGVWPMRRPITEIAAQMSLPYGVAVAVVDGAATVDQFLPGRINRDDVWDMIGRITVRHDPGIDALGPAARLHTRLAVRWRDGRVERVEVATPPGGLGRPLSNSDIRAKFRTITRPVLDPARQDRIEAAVLGVAALDGAAELIALLGEPVPPLFGAAAR